MSDSHPRDTLYSLQLCRSICVRFDFNSRCSCLTCDRTMEDNLLAVKMRVLKDNSDMQTKSIGHLLKLVEMNVI